MEEAYVNRLAPLGNELDTPVAALLIGISGDRVYISVFRPDWYHLLLKTVRRLGLDELVIEYQSYKGVRIPKSMLSNLSMALRIGNLELYRLRNESLIVLRCVAERCEDDPSTLELLRDVDWSELIEEAARFSEEEFRRGSNLVPVYELFAALSSMRKKNTVVVPEHVLDKLARHCTDYIRSLYERTT